MQLYFGGAEASEWRHFLAEEGVTHVSMSYAGLSKRLKLVRPWAIADHFTEETHVLLDAGGYTYNRPPVEGKDPLTEEDAMELAQKYMEFVTANIDRVDAVTEFDADILGQDWLRSMREDFYDDLGDKFIPVWHSDTGTAGLEALASRYERVGVLRAGIPDDAASKFSALVARYGVKLHALGMTKPEMIQAVKWDSVGSLSWIDPSINGSTIIWAQNDLHWYPKKYKEQARKRHRTWIEQQGFDVDKILADDRKEVLRLSVWSWQQFMNSLGGPPRVTPHVGTPARQNAERAPGAVTPPSSERGTERLLPAVPRTRKLLPVIGVVEQEGEDGSGPENRVYAPSKSLMRCSTCVIRDVCPEFQAESECAYELPVDVTSKNQLRHAHDTMISIQFQRVARMSMIEQAQGGYADANMSAEIDRFSRLVKQRQEAEKSGVSINITGTGDAGTGVISRLFGTEISDTLAAIDPASTNEVFRDAGIVDAVVVPDGE